MCGRGGWYRVLEGVAMVESVGRREGRSGGIDACRILVVQLDSGRRKDVADLGVVAGRRHPGGEEAVDLVIDVVVLENKLAAELRLAARVPRHGDTSLQERVRQQEKAGMPRNRRAP